MAARDGIVFCEENDWTELTDNDVTAIMIQNQGGRIIKLRATAGSIKPSLESPSGHELEVRDTLCLGVAGLPSVAEFFQGVSGANRIWAYVALASADVYVSHSD